MHKNTVKISVIIPVFNRENTIERALDSVLSQTYFPMEIIVIDDASDDGTAKILQRYIHEIKIFRQNINMGVSVARNRGIAEAKGEWIAFLDSDDEWFSHKLETQIKYLKNHPEIHILQSEEQWIRNEKKVNPPVKYIKKGGKIFKNCLKTCIVGPSTVICRRELLQEMRGFDENLTVCEDYDLWLRIAAKYPIPLIDEILINKYGGHKDQLSLITPAMDRFRVQSLEKIFQQENLSSEQRKALLDELILKLGYLHEGALRRGMNGEEYFEKLKKFNDKR
jgi:glycosyltransferase involved in cell wall biosynthesis